MQTRPEAGAATHQDYLREARSWETSRVEQLHREKRTAWAVATGSVILTFASVVALAMLAPLKSVQPYVVRVDNATGSVDIVNGLVGGKTTYEEAVNKYFIQWYVRYREGYSRDLAEEYYYNTGLMSAPIEQQRYADLFSPKNPRSPLNLYGPYAKVRIRVKSTSFIQPNVALVRYTKEIERGADRPALTHWAATVSFRYTSAPMGERDRGINPLGFRVTEFRNDPDTGSDLPAGPGAVLRGMVPEATRSFQVDPAPSVRDIVVPAIE